MLLALAKFDVRVGNQIVWTSEHVDFATLPGIEFKMIPSGLHERASDTIYFVSGNWHGVACFESRVSGLPGSRENVQMYSLAALVPHSSSLPWNQETFLRGQLTNFLDNNANTGLLPVAPTPYPDPQSHPVHSTKAFLLSYGPLCFEIWKAGLVRSRVLLAALPHNTIKEMSHFTYIASQLGKIPTEVQELLPRRRPPVPILYNVAISDLQRLQSAETYWATTTDGLLATPSRDACDVWVQSSEIHDYAAGQRGATTRATWRDRYRFSLLAEPLNQLQARHGILESLADAVANGMLWWASGGESTLMNRDDTAPLLIDIDEDSSESRSSASSDGVALVGQFQQYTCQLVRVFARLAQDDDSVIRVTAPDIAAMGLDPVAQSDREFLQRFSLTWWDRPVVFGKMCC